MDMNNYYLHGSNKYVYRGYNITPRENLISRFGGPKADKLLSNLSASCAESKHRLKYPY
jgi:hypothetical protein